VSLGDAAVDGEDRLRRVTPRPSRLVLPAR
jgi:hypothetical protein